MFCPPPVCGCKILIMLPVAVQVLQSALDVARQCSYISCASYEFSNKACMRCIMPCDHILFRKCLQGIYPQLGRRAQCVRWWQIRSSTKACRLRVGEDRNGWNRLRHKPWRDWWCGAVCDCRYCRQGVQLHEGESNEGFPRFRRPGLPKADRACRRGKAFCLIEDAIDYCSLRGASAV